MISIKERIKRLGWDPGLLALFVESLRLLWHIEDLGGFRKSLAYDDWEAAKEYTDLSQDELQDRITQLRERSERIAEALPGMKKVGYVEIDTT